MGINAEANARAKMDAVGDIIIYLASYCTSSDLDLHHCLEVTWAKVKKRDWVADPEGEVMTLKFFMRSQRWCCSSSPCDLMVVPRIHHQPRTSTTGFDRCRPRLLGRKHPVGDQEPPHPESSCGGTASGGCGEVRWTTAD
jgi:hypothetical protein